MSTFGRCLVRCQHARNEIARLLGLSANHFVVLEPVSMLMHYYANCHQIFVCGLRLHMGVLLQCFISRVFGACCDWTKNQRFQWARHPPRKSHVDASPESFGPQILNPYAKTQHEMKIATSFLQVPSFSKYVSKRFWDNPFTQPCLRIRSSRKTLQLDLCAVPEGSPSMQTADSH